LEKKRSDDAKRAQPEPPVASQLHSGCQRSVLMALADVLQGSALQSQNSELTAELQKWERFVRIALDVEDHLDGRPAGALELEAILRRIVRVQEAACAGSCAVRVSLERGISPHQAILCAWLFECWLTLACEPSSHDRSPTVRVSVSSVETPPEIRMSLSLSDVPAPKLWREWCAAQCGWRPAAFWGDHSRLSDSRAAAPSGNRGRGKEHRCFSSPGGMPANPCRH
jgi:hypothetical protein